MKAGCQSCRPLIKDPTKLKLRPHRAVPGPLYWRPSLSAVWTPVQRQTATLEEARSKRAPPGATRAIEILRTEVERVIGLLGCDSIANLDPACVRWRGAGRLHATNRAQSGASGEELRGRKEHRADVGNVPPDALASVPDQPARGE